MKLEEIYPSVILRGVTLPFLVVPVFLFILTLIIPATTLFGVPILIIVSVTIASMNHMNKTIAVSE